MCPAGVRLMDFRVCCKLSPYSSGVEHFLGKEEVPGSNPGMGSMMAMMLFMELHSMFIVLQFVVLSALRTIRLIKQ